MSTPAQPSAASTQLLQVHGKSVAYYDEGPKSGAPVVVAIHGLPGSGRDFRWLAPELTSRCRLIRLDMPGFGDTPLASMPLTSVADRAAFVVAVASALDLQRYHLLGHSMGGALAAKAAALDASRVQSVALISSIGPRPHQLYRRLAKFWWLVPLVRGRVMERLFNPPIKKVFARGGFRGPYPEGAELHTMRCIYGMSFETHGETVASLQVPTFISYCADDPLIEEPIFEALVALAPAGPRLVFPDGAHNPQKAHAVELGGVLTAWYGKASFTR